MMNISQNLSELNKTIPAHVSLVAVSKTKSNEQIMEAYQAGLRIFGENYIQELCDKQVSLPADIKWHMIGHLQSNKVKYIAKFIDLIHGVDSAKLLTEIDKQALKNNRIIDVLLQVHIASEESKFGFDESDILHLLNQFQLNPLHNIRIRGLMGMATFTEDENQVRKEFTYLSDLFQKVKSQFYREDPMFNILSMGMSGDYELAISCGSTMVRIGSKIFGERK